jgi:hypothetical protein
VRESLDLPEQGLVITEVQPRQRRRRRRPLRAHLQRPGERRRVPGRRRRHRRGRRQPVPRAEDLQRIVFGKSEGDVVELEVWRNGETRTVEVTLRPAQVE